VVIADACPPSGENLFQNNRIAFNDIGQWGQLASDLGGVYITACENGRGTFIDHNVVWNTNGNGIQLNGFAAMGDGPGPAYDNTVNNNTVGFGTVTSLAVVRITPDGLRGSYVSNNIFTTGSAICDAAGLCRGNQLGGYPNFMRDPGFVAAGDWHLHAGSAAVDAATPLWTDSSPVDARVTPAGRPDYGAYERGGLDWRPGPR
jgi:hypothetical protein